MRSLKVANFYNILGEKSTKIWIELNSIISMTYNLFKDNLMYINAKEELS